MRVRVLYQTVLIPPELGGRRVLHHYSTQPLLEESQSSGFLLSLLLHHPGRGLEYLFITWHGWRPRPPTGLLLTEVIGPPLSLWCLAGVCRFVISLQEHCFVQWFTRRTLRLSLLYSPLRFTAAGYKAKSAKGKPSWNEVQRKSGTTFQEFCLSGMAQAVHSFSVMNCDNTMMCFCPGKLETQYPRFLEGWSCRYSRPNTNFRLLEGTHGSVINMVSMNNLGTMRHSTHLGKV